MRYKLLGSSGLRVSELCLGALTFGTEAGIGSEKAESFSVFEAFANAGGNFIDTANKYNNGTSERYLGDFVSTDRDRFVLATKYALTMRPDDPNAGGNHRKNMRQSVEESLKRLKTDYIDLYWLHQWDFTTGEEEVMRGLDDLIRAGKVHYIGISDTPAWLISRSHTIAELRGWSRFVALQVEYSLIERTAERDLIPMAKHLDFGVTVWGAVAAGILTGKYKPGATPNDGLRTERNAPRLNERNLEIAATVESVAKARGTSAAQVALNWVRQQNQQMFPIIGNRTVAQIEDNIASLDNPLTDEELDTLNAASAIELGFPHEFLTRESMISMRLGDSADRLDNHRALTHMDPGHERD